MSTIKKKTTLALFYQNGTTFLFKGVEDFKIKGNNLSFVYDGQHTQEKRYAEFNLLTISGYSLTFDTDMEEKNND